jgi:hypothetical protein
MSAGMWSGTHSASASGPARRLFAKARRRRAISLLPAALAAGVIAGCGASLTGQQATSASLVASVQTTATTTANRPATGSPAIEPNLSGIQLQYMLKASNATAARDPVCSPYATHVPLTSKGSPDRALTSILGVLRRPATQADRSSLIQEVLPGGGPGGGIGSSPPTGADVYINAIRRARTALGVTFYILPAGQVAGLRRTPARCEAEQTDALRHELRHVSTPPEQILQLQRQYLAWQRYAALHPEGIFLATVNAKAVGDDGGASTAQIEQQGLFDGNADRPVGALDSGVVPDGVATVTERYSDARPVTARVVNNVFVAVPPHVPRHGDQGLMAFVWRSANGRLIDVIPNTGY